MLALVMSRKSKKVICRKRCPTCQLPVPISTEEYETILPGLTVPCSEFHVRCERCGWPVAKSMIVDLPLCLECAGRKL